MTPPPITAAHARAPVLLKPVAGFACTAMAVVIALLCGAPEAMVKDWGVGLLLALEVEAPAVWFLVLDAPNFWHVAVFAALTAGLLAAVPGRPRLCVHLAMLLGVLLETAQIFVPGREAGLGDLLCNLAGVGGAYLFYRALEWMVKRTGFGTSGSKGARIQGAEDPRGQGAEDPRGQGSKGPRDQGSKDSRGQGFLFQRFDQGLQHPLDFSNVRE